MRRIAAVVGRSVATVSRLLARLGLSSLKALDPVPLIVRYEREAPGELPHMDTKKLRRIKRPSPCVTGNRRDSVDGAGWESRMWRSATIREPDSCRCIGTSAGNRLSISQRPLWRYKPPALVISSSLMALHPVLPLAIASALALVVNYLGSKYFAFS